MKEGDEGAGLPGDGGFEDEDEWKRQLQQQLLLQQQQLLLLQQQQPAVKKSDSPPPRIGLFDAPVAGGGAAAPPPPADARGSSQTFKLKANQELRFEVKAESNQQARRATAVLVMKEGLAEVCGAELAGGKEYEFRDAALIGVFTYHGCTLTLSGSYHVVSPDAISQPVPMTFVACLHAQLQNAREAAAAAAEASAPAPRPLPPRIMIAGGEKSGTSSLSYNLNPKL